MMDCELGLRWEVGVRKQNTGRCTNVPSKIN